MERPTLRPFGNPHWTMRTSVQDTLHFIKDFTDLFILTHRFAAGGHDHGILSPQLLSLLQLRGWFSVADWNWVALEDGDFLLILRSHCFHNGLFLKHTSHSSIHSLITRCHFCGKLLSLISETSIPVNLEFLCGKKLWYGTSNRGTSLYS